MAILTKGELSEAFRDTVKFIEGDPVLREAALSSRERTKFYPSDFSEEVETVKEGDIRVVEGRTFQEALRPSREFPGQKIAVLNFAASTRPGGGVWGGAFAQEESLCRSSTLYPTLDNPAMMETYYIPHKEHYDFRGWDDCIYSPDVVICKDDSDGIPARLRPDEFVKVDVVTCAAPHLRGEAVTSEELFSIHVRRARNILRVCAFNGADIFVGGAFGCGAFHNDPLIVSRAWGEALKDYREKFSLVVFAIYVSDFPGKHEEGKRNLRAFRNEFTE